MKEDTENQHCHGHNHGDHCEGHHCHHDEHGHGGEGHHCHCGGHHHEADPGLYDKIRDTLGKYDYSLTMEEAEHEAAHIIEHHSEDNNTAKVMRFLFESLELTSLKVTDNEESILALVEKINSFEDAYPELPHPAAICVYPNFVKLVNESLEVDGVGITSVCGAFPSAQTYNEVRLVEIALAHRDGADETDIVLPVGQFLSEDYESIDEYIEEAKAYVEDSKLKVILETSALQSAENIMKAAILSMYCGADFVKTSTGKLSVGATPGAVYAMCMAIKQYNARHNYKIGIKIAGGVRTVADAVGYYSIVRETLGDEWLTPTLFRIGASSLANALIGGLTASEAKYF